MKVDSAVFGLLASLLAGAAYGRRHPNIPSIPTVKARDTGRPTSYPANYFDQKIDHFPTSDKYLPHPNETFTQRYYFDDTYYEPGELIFVQYNV
jgi:hypothetical protein